MSQNHWLMKAEPDSRVVKGKDVKFSIDDFESVTTSPWEGVRNYEARNLMREMKVGDKVLFYHSNCKNPGIAGFAEVSKEAYPDYTAWDSAHPYFDAKTDQNNPKWYMVDVMLVSRAAHFVPLALLRNIAAAVSSSQLPAGVNYLGEDDIRAIKDMALVSRGRLSVQRVEAATWGIIEVLAEKGGWDDSMLRSKRPEPGDGPRGRKPKTRRKVADTSSTEYEKHKSDKDNRTDEERGSSSTRLKGKRKGEEDEKVGSAAPRRSTRRKTAG